MITVVNDKAQQGRFKSNPKDRVFKCLDLLGRKIYTSSSLQVRIASQQALLARYGFLNWLAMARFEEQLPKASSEKFWVFFTESYLVAKTSLQSALRVTCTLGKVMASAITVRRGLPAFRIQGLLWMSSKQSRTCPNTRFTC